MWNSYLLPPNPANATDVNNIFANQQYIYNQLINNGITIDSIDMISASPDMFYSEIADIYVKIEKNLDLINDNIYQSAYYIASVTRGNYEPDRSEWQRWIDVLNDMYNILNGITGKWQYLVCIDEYPLIDGKKIVLRGDKI